MIYIEDLLVEGGAAGHISHVYENLDLTFGELKDIIARAAEGRLEKVSEKLDGLNLVFTYDVSSDNLKVARSGGDIKRGGLDASALAQKFQGRGNLEVAFSSAFDVLEKAIGSLSDETKEAVFGPNGNVWYSIEVIYTKNPNVINYDNNNVVFHGWPIFEINDDGTVSQTSDDSGVKLLSSKVEQMQKALGARDWKIRGPSLLNMKKLSDGSVARRALGDLSSVMASSGASDSSTVYDHLRALMHDEVKSLDLDPDVEDLVVERAIEAPGAPSINDIKRVVVGEKRQEVLNFIKNAPAVKESMMQPIKSTLNTLAKEVIKGLESTLIASPDSEVTRLKSQLRKVVSAAQSSGNPAAIDFVSREMQKLGDIDNISSPMEGIVFFYKGQAYKFTYPFALLNQVLNVFKHGSKSIPKMDIGESVDEIVDIYDLLV